MENGVIPSPSRPFSTYESALAVGICLIFIVSVFLTNLIFPFSYSFFAWNHGGYLPLLYESIWTLLCGSGLFLWYRRQGSPLVDHRWFIVLFLFLIGATLASFWIFECPYPSMNGDNIPDKTYRLRAFTSDWVNYYFLDNKDFKKGTLWAERAWGVLYVAIAAYCTWKMHKTNRELSIGLLAYFLTVPPLLNAYGHYDGYTSVLVTQALWWIALWKYDHQPNIRSLFYLLVAIFIALWANPLHLLLMGLTVFYLFISQLNKFVPNYFDLRLRWKILVLCAISIGVLSAFTVTPNYFVHGPFRQDCFPALDSSYLAWMLHSGFMNLITTCLAGVLMVAWILFSVRKKFYPASPLVYTVVLGMLTALVLRYTLPFLQGINDEFATGCLGLIICFGAPVLLMKWLPLSAQTGVICFAILSIYLQVPKLIMYSGDSYVQRYRDLYPNDKCQNHQRLSPYIALGLIIPKNVPHLRDAKLETFLEGYKNPDAYWKSHQTRCLQFYIAWSYELGKPEQARSALLELATHDPAEVFYICSDDATLTSKAVTQIRKDGVEIFWELWKKTSNFTYYDAWETLNDIQKILGKKPPIPSSDLWDNYRHL